MKKPTFLPLFLLAIFTISCGGIKNTIKNIDDSAPTPLLKKDNSFVITTFSDDSKYGYDPDYPINIYYRSTANDSINQERFLKALAGPNGEKLFYKKIESCCPFPTKRSEIGAGFLDVYQIHWVGCKKPLLLHFNIYEKGILMVPKGLTIKKDE
ncbi:MAG: 2-dehydro-3-deoxyphosphooctonate aldolase [Flavobacterium sp.]|uniref:2-dehydro-3-deoxyphosphooctonate aldolase n=1 Tax=Flavobacterium sp. TaxID=239 RepID=UPI001E137716|nr:2-dehydro-3-deoxyphosphooctonate aldolase [Flavobacterium sp.]